MNIDLGVESRNTAKATAKKHAALHLQPDDDGGDADPAKPLRCLEFEDVGGQPVDDDEPLNEDEDDVSRPQGLVMDKVVDAKWIQQLLAREKEIARARQAGRSPDECKVMKKVGEVYGSLFDQVLDSLPVQPRECLGFHTDTPLALEAQARRAEAIRRQCDGKGDDAEELDAE